MKNFTKTFFQKVVQASLALTLALGIGAVGPAATPTHTAEAATIAKGDSIIMTGKRYLGVPYRYGAEFETSRRFDCSSFTQYVYKKNGISLPRGARQQARVGKYVPRNQLKKGDLVFFSTKATLKYSRSSIKRIGHVGIYAGNGKILHTYGKPGVTYSNLNSSWWSKNYVTARRVL